MLYRFDFGPGPASPGYTKVTAATATPYYAWIGARVSERDRGKGETLTRDFIHGQDAEFRLGLDDGDYTLTLTFGDPDFPHGPFDVLVGGRVVLADVQTGKNEFKTESIQASVTGQALSLRLRATKAPNWTLCALVVEGPPQRAKHAILAGPSRVVPSPAEIDARTADPRRALRECCEFLMKYRGQRGVFEDYVHEWYRMSYGLRTLLAGSVIFDQPRYREAVERALDEFVAQQLPNGAWSSGIQAKRTAEQPPETIKGLMAGTTNLADIGSIVSCLSIAAPRVDAERRKRYIAAAQRYADEYAVRFILPSGAFTNGRWQGQDMTVPYSVACGTQAMNFAALSVVTGQEKYLHVAEGAARFLLDHWQPDGRPIHCHHAKDVQRVTAATNFGDIFYYHEGILWVAHHTRDQGLLEQVRRVYGWHIAGEKGLLAERENGVWWPPRDPWTNSKAAGMPCVLMAYQRLGGTAPGLDEAIRRCITFVANPEYRQRIGVTADPLMPWGRFGVAATGFGGLTLAEAVRPGLIYMAE